MNMASSESLDEIRKRWENLQEMSPEEPLPRGSPTMFEKENNENLVKWQLDIKEELNRIEHLLRGHIPAVDERGNFYYKEPEESQKLLNERGVSEVLNILSWYLNKNFILSNWDAKEINLRMSQFHQVITDFIFNNYQDIGLNTKEKLKYYPLIVTNLVNTVEAVYHRALNGEERKSLREARQVTQNEPLYPQGFNNNPQPNNKFSFFKPSSWRQ